jgi:hypothetical protein
MRLNSSLYFAFKALAKRLLKPAVSKLARLPPTLLAARSHSTIRRIPSEDRMPKWLVLYKQYCRLYSFLFPDGIKYVLTLNQVKSKHTFIVRRAAFKGHQ